MKTKKIIQGAELLELSPHRNGMILLSRVTEFDTENRFVATQFDVNSSCIFFEENGIPSWVSFEIMAQSISALNGIIDRLNGVPSKAGCLLSVSDFKTDAEFFSAGETLSVEAAEEFRDDESKIYRYRCRLVSDRNPCVVSATVTAMEAEDLSSLLKN
jgi:predicted hotdog family 3-hydroxylacyl-ACP dehydratase